MAARDDLVIRHVPHRIARLACQHWHYSRVCPKTNLVWGYWRGDVFDGVIAFRRALPGHTTQAWWELVFDSQAIAELCRMALRPQDDRPPTTRYLSLALGEMRAAGFRRHLLIRGHRAGAHGRRLPCRQLDGAGGEPGHPPVVPGRRLASEPHPDGHGHQGLAADAPTEYQTTIRHRAHAARAAGAGPVCGRASAGGAARGHGVRVAAELAVVRENCRP